MPCNGKPAFCQKKKEIVPVAFSDTLNDMRQIQQTCTSNNVFTLVLGVLSDAVPV